MVPSRVSQVNASLIGPPQSGAPSILSYAAGRAKHLSRAFVAEYLVEKKRARYNGRQCLESHVRSRIVLISFALSGLCLTGCGSRARAPLPTPTARPSSVTAALTIEPDLVAPAVIAMEPGEDVSPPVISLTSDLSLVPWLGTARIRAETTASSRVEHLELWAGGQQVAAIAGGALSYDLAPARTDGMTPGEAYRITARAIDSRGNQGEASLMLQVGERPGGLAAEPTLPASRRPSQASFTAEPARASPTITPPHATPGLPATPEPPPTTSAPTTLRVTEISIPTYPFEPYVRTMVDPGLGDYPVVVLDRAAYEASNPRPVSKTYKLIVLENAYLRLGVLPELGGRLYQVVFKPTGNDELYQNPVIKPTGWGPPSPPYPPGANWWLAAGGMEWGFPVEEHGYEWATAWGYDFVPAEDGGIMLSLFTRDSRRPYVVVDIILPPDAAYFIVRPRITNAWGSSFRFQWWVNAMLAPGPANRPGPALRFVFPNSEMTVHSTGDATLPAAGQPMSWPEANGRDMSRLGNWNQWLGFFQRPAAAGDFSGVYDPAADEGMARVYPSGVARGSKGFAPGWSDPIDSRTWTDDGSGYVELQGGLTPTFSDWYELAPGDEITWDEIWYPVAGLGGLTYATAGGAIHLSPAGNGLRVAIFPTQPLRGRLAVTVPGTEPALRDVAISPAAPFSETFPYTASSPARGAVTVALTDEDGREILSYRGEVSLR
jgi:hypothetical protein